MYILIIIYSLSPTIHHSTKTAASACWNTESDPSGTEYRGKLAETITGKKCQTWYFQFPHKNDDYKQVPDGAWHGFCRNPGGVKNGPWCLTNDMKVRWEYCDVEKCENQKIVTNKPVLLPRTTVFPTTFPTTTPKSTNSQIPPQNSQNSQNKPKFTSNGKNDEEHSSSRFSISRTPREPTPRENIDCVNYRGTQKYRGTLSVTTQGYECQRWDVSTVRLEK